MTIFVKIYNKLEASEHNDVRTKHIGRLVDQLLVNQSTKVLINPGKTNRLTTEQVLAVAFLILDILLHQ